MTTLVKKSELRNHLIKMCVSLADKVMPEENRLAYNNDGFLTVVNDKNVHGILKKINQKLEKQKIKVIEDSTIIKVEHFEYAPVSIFNNFHVMFTIVDKNNRFINSNCFWFQLGISHTLGGKKQYFITFQTDLLTDKNLLIDENYNIISEE